MKFINARKLHRLPPLILTVAFVLLLGIVVLNGCRDKANPPAPPNGPQQGEWSLVLTTPPSMFRDSAGGHVPSDTIPVRLYDSTGALVNGKRVLSQCDVSVGDVEHVVITSNDITNRPWGCSPPLTYRGNGGVDGHETIRSFAITIASGDTDTLAEATASFKVFDPLPIP